MVEQIVVHSCSEMSMRTLVLWHLTRQIVTDAYFVDITAWMKFWKEN